MGILEIVRPHFKSFIRTTPERTSLSKILIDPIDIRPLVNILRTGS